MKIKIKEFTRENTFLSHLILNSINEAALKTVTNDENRDGETEVDVELKFNGVEIDIRKFTTMLESSWESAVKKACKPEALEIFEKMKHKFKSEKSMNSQINKIREQIQKANNQLINISNNIDLLSNI